MSTNLSGAIKPTARYPRFVYGGTILDFDDPIAAHQPEDASVSGSNVAASGRREVLWERNERVFSIATGFLRPLAARDVQRFILDWASRGNQCEVYLDRFLRAWWGFDEGALTDNNGGNAFVFSSGSATYVTLADGRGIQIPAAGTLIAPLVSSLVGGGGNTFLALDQGTIVLQVKPDWAAADGVAHVFLDAVVEGALTTNRLKLQKTAGNLLQFTHTDSATVAVTAQLTPTWSANTEHIIICEWSAGQVALRLDGGTIATAAKSGAMTTAPNRLAIGTDHPGTGGRATGVVGMVALYQFAYGVPVSIGDFQFPWRSYYPAAELLDSSYTMARPMPTRELYAYQLRLREVASVVVETSSPQKTTVALDATSVTVPVLAIDANYIPLVTPNWDTSFWIPDSTKLTASFVVQFSVPAPSGAAIYSRIER